MLIKMGCNHSRLNLVINRYPYFNQPLRCYTRHGKLAGIIDINNKKTEWYVLDGEYRTSIVEEPCTFCFCVPMKPTKTSLEFYNVTLFGLSRYNKSIQLEADNIYYCINMTIYENQIETKKYRFTVILSIGKHTCISKRYVGTYYIW